MPDINEINRLIARLREINEALPAARSQVASLEVAQANVARRIFEIRAGVASDAPSQVPPVVKGCMMLR